MENSTEASPQNSSDASKDNLNIEVGINNMSKPSTEEKNTADIVTEKKLKKKTFRVPLKVKLGWLC